MMKKVVHGPHSLGKDNIYWLKENPSVALGLRSRYFLKLLPKQRNKFLVARNFSEPSLKGKK